jgi:hypothetical protein
MKNISFIKKLKLFLEYIKVIRKNKAVITDKTNKLNLRIDNAFRIYTVYNCPDDAEIYGPKLAEKYIKEYVSQVDKLCVNLGLSEYIGVWDIQQIDTSSFLIIFGFKFFQTNKFMTKLVGYTTVALLALILIFFMI